MLQKTRGIVLHALRYKDNSLIVDIYTEVAGRVSFVVTVSRSKKSSLKTVFFQPLALVELEADFRPNATLYRIMEAKLFHPFVSLPFDPYKSSIALFLAEFLYRAVHEGGENRPLFAYLIHSVQWLDTCERGFANFHLVFLMRLSRFLGLYPNLDGYEQGAYFDLLNSNFTLLRPSHHTHYLSPEEASRISLLMRMNYDTMHLFRMNRMERARCLNILTDYYRLHLPPFPELKSLDVLRELFGD